MPRRDSERILSDYDSNRELFEEFRATCERLVKELLQLSEFRVHSVTSRVKERSHVREKLQRSGKSYASLSDITDVVGVRVITQFEDDVDRIGNVIETEFVANPYHS